MLAQIGNTDITPWIQESTYVMNKVNVYKDWVDGNYTKRRNVNRTRVEGDFDMVFTNDSDLNAFLSLLSNNTTSGYVTITLWISNKNVSEQHQMLYSFDNKNNRQINNNYVYKRFKMKMEER